MKRDFFRSKKRNRTAVVETDRGVGGRHYTTVTFTTTRPYRVSERTKVFPRRKEGLAAAREFVA